MADNIAPEYPRTSPRCEALLCWAAALPWILLLVAGLLWALTLQRAVPALGKFLIAQPIAVAGIIVLAALAVAMLDILMGALSLLWARSRGGVAALTSGLAVCGGACAAWTGL